MIKEFCSNKIKTIPFAEIQHTQLHIKNLHKQYYFQSFIILNKTMKLTEKKNKKIQK